MRPRAASAAGYAGNPASLSTFCEGNCAKVCCNCVLGQSPPESRATLHDITPTEVVPSSLARADFLGLFACFTAQWLQANQVACEADKLMQIPAAAVLKAVGECATVNNALAGSLSLTGVLGASSCLMVDAIAAVLHLHAG